MIHRISLLLLCLCAPWNLHARTWTDATGKFKIDADFVELTEGKLVQLKLSSGEIRAIPVSKLSEDDRKHVATLIETEMETNPYSSGSPRVSAKSESLPKILPPQSSSNVMASVMEVIAVGVGLSKEEAQKDAYRNAVRQVVGLYLDSQTLVENDELIEDKILSASNGVVRTAKTIPSSVTEQDGLWRLRARVTVEVTGVTSRLAEAKVIKQKIDGESMFATALSKVEKKQSTEELLKELFAELPNMVKLSLQGAPDYDTNTGELIYTVELTPDIEAYREFLPRLTKALETVAVKRLPESIVRPMPSGELRDGDIKDVEGVLGFWLGKKDPRTSPGEGIVTVLSFWNRKHTSQKWNSYLVDLGVLKEKNINKYRPSNHWLHGMSRSYANQQYRGHDLAMNVDVTFFTKDGDPIDADRWTWDCDYYPEYNVTSGRRELLSGSPNLLISRICQYRADSISYDYWYPDRNNNFSVIIAPFYMAIGSGNLEKNHPFLFRLNSKKTRRIKFNSEQLKDLADVQISFRTEMREPN